MPLMQAGDLCLVTGVSGYLASWLAKNLLDAGFRVRGTVRSLADTEKVDTMRALLPGLELAEAELRSPEGWAQAVAGCQWVFHVASPQAVPSETDRTGGAVQGTEHLTRAAFAEPSVRKIVVTSSEAAIAYGLRKQRFTEDDWTNLDSAAGRNDYFRSKTLAEKRAWALAADRDANPRQVPLAVVNPGFILGPSLVLWGRFSMDSLRAQAEGRTPALLDMVTHIVDVRDCARMHIAVMDDPATDGHRHFCFAMTATMLEMSRIIRDNYASIGLKPTMRVAPNVLIWAMQFFQPDAGSIYDKLGHDNLYETKWPDVYRYQYTDLAASIRASIDRMLELGWLKAPSGAPIALTLSSANNCGPF